MRWVFNFIIKSNKRYNNSKDIEGKELILNTEISERDYMYTNRIGIVKAIPAIIKKVRFKLDYTPEANKAERLLKAVKDKNLKEPVGISRIDKEIREGQITPGIGSENRAIDIIENIS